MADQHAELDQERLVELGLKAGPGRVPDSALGMTLADGGKEEALARGPAGRVGTLADPLDLLRREPGARPEPLVMPPLVLVVGAVGDAQDDQLAVGPRQLAARHQRAREPEPAAKETTVAGERGEDVRRLPARGEPDHPDDRRVDEPDLLAAPRRDTRFHRPSVRAFMPYMAAKLGRAPGRPDISG